MNKSSLTPKNFAQLACQDGKPRHVHRHADPLKQESPNAWYKSCIFQKMRDRIALPIFMTVQFKQNFAEDPDIGNSAFDSKRRERKLCNENVLGLPFVPPAGRTNNSLPSSDVKT